MANVSKFSFQNVKDNTKSLILKALGMKSNYGEKPTASPETVLLSNSTTATDQPELIQIKFQEIESVDTMRKKNQHPPLVKGGVQYTIKTEEYLSVTSEADPVFRVDYPICVSLQIRHPQVAEIDASTIEQVVVRALSVLYKDDGSCRINDIMRGNIGNITD